MSDVSKTNELIAEAREWSGSQASWGDNGLVDRLADALEAATEPHDRVVCKRIADQQSRSWVSVVKANSALIDQLDAATAAVKRVRSIHYNAGPSQGYGSQFKGGYGMFENCCAACGSHGEYGVEYPCPTVTALDGAPEPKVKP